MNGSLPVFIWVAAGGALGAVLRYYIGLCVLGLMGNSFPWGTLLVNVLGSFFMGVGLGFSSLMQISESVRLALMTGLLGALTTYSTFAGETLLLMQSAQWIKALTNIGCNTALCLVAVYIGQQLIFFGYK